MVRSRLPPNSEPLPKVDHFWGCHQSKGCEGIGPIVATCLSASVPDATLFEGGREFAAWRGLVPRQHSTDGKPRLGPISKMGNRHLRKLLVVGAHAALYRMRKGTTDTPLANWREDCSQRSPSSLSRLRSPARSPASPGRSWRGTWTSSRATALRAQRRPDHDRALSGKQLAECRWYDVTAKAE